MTGYCKECEKIVETEGMTDNWTGRDVECCPDCRTDKYMIYYWMDEFENYLRESKLKRILK